ncbi:class F sortase [Blastococcus goldschmidtiae]|uniref:Class F sortase n=1 Tax=Blastococcus goldschmidtiae TaxID=3075546 RepID=A0ABU2KDX7_9ACTN|nr:class F sortase [Blastococcus sp. DSM 46792]MDT0278372.1 class F sortase [Blastococcus sp. DSM 46792]
MRPGPAPLRRASLLAMAGAAALLVSCAAQGSGPGASPSPPSSAGSAPTAGADRDPAPPPAPAVVDPASVPVPVAVSVPALGLVEELVDLGIAADGTAEVPTDFDRVGWFTGGGRPGARGPTVLMGHVDSTAGPAVFYDLRELEPGNLVEVTSADGTAARYAVSDTQQVAKGEFPTAAVFGATATDVLRLITCIGEFDQGARSYTDNLVVTAERLP